MRFDEAQRALYIDFECLMARPPRRPHPALLGVLVGAVDEEFEQIITDERLAITDERLAPAAVARDGHS